MSKTTAQGSPNGPRKIFGRENVNWSGPKRAATSNATSDIKSIKSDFLSESFNPKDLKFEHHTDIIAQNYEQEINYSKAEQESYRKSSNGFDDLFSQRFDGKPDNPVRDELLDAYRKEHNHVLAVEGVEYPTRTQKFETNEGYGVKRTYKHHPFNRKETYLIDKEGNKIIENIYELSDNTHVVITDSLNDEGNEIEDSKIIIISTTKESNPPGEIRIESHDVIPEEHANFDQVRRYTTYVSFSSPQENIDHEQALEYAEKCRQLVTEAQAAEYLANSLRQQYS